MGMLSSFANPHRFLALSNWLAPLFYALGAALIAWGLWQGLWMVPKDEYQGGDIMRVMFIHVPAAWLAMASYSAMAVASFIWFVWRHELADIAAKAIAPLGATWTALCLATGSVWGKPTWGTWWQWDDARMMSVLFLLFLFLGYMALRAAMDSRQKAARAGAILAMVGGLNVPLGRAPARQIAGGRLMDFLPDLDKNAVYIWACYGLGLVLIGGAVIGVMLKARAAKAALERMNASDEDAS